MTSSAQTTKRDRTSDNSGDRIIDKISESNFRRNPIPLFVLVSILVHGIGFVLFSFIERSQPRVQLVPEAAPIEFVTVPPEEIPETTEKDPNPQEETQAKKTVEPKAPNPEPKEPITPSPTVAAPETIPKPIPKEPQAPEKVVTKAPPKPQPPIKKEIVPPPAPKPIPESVPNVTKPPKKLETESLPKREPITTPLPFRNFEENQNSPEILNGSDTVLEETETTTPEIEKLTKPPIESEETEDSPLATRLPPRITPTQPLAPVEPAASPQETANNESANNPVATRLPPKVTPTPQPTTSPSPPSKTTTDSGAASLLGDNLKRSYEDDKGRSFFDLENNASQQALNPDLNPQQRLDMRNYFEEIKRRVRRNWNPNYAVQEYNTVLSFSIQRNGQIALLKVRRTSGSQDVDRQALQAVQNSGPFDPLPANYPSDMLNVEFNFNIYVY